MKSGIEYFPLDCQLDEKFELIEAEFGLTGFAVVVKLLQRIYSGQGYYCEWTNEVALLFSKKIGLGCNVVSEIVESSIRRGIFDKSLYEDFGILTSRGIQNRYLEAVSRRKKVEVKNEYLLINCDQISKNVDISSENVCRNQNNADISKQSKVKESRVNKRKGKESILSAKPEALQSAYLDFIEMRKKIKKPLTDRALQLIIGKVESLSSDIEIQIAIINQSVEHCWQSVYPLREADKSAKKENTAYDLNDFDKYSLNFLQEEGSNEQKN